MGASPPIRNMDLNSCPQIPTLWDWGRLGKEAITKTKKKKPQVFAETPKKKKTKNKKKPEAGGPLFYKFRAAKIGGRKFHKRT